MKNIAVIGAGAMGNGIAHAFAQSGFKVQLIDVNQAALTTAVATITKNLDRLVAKDKIDETDKSQTLDNISTFTNIAEGVEYASLVVEAATENVDLKLKIFKELDQACPEDTILATNTSSISITQIAAQTSRPDRVIGMHFMNPVPLMKLVEIIAGYNTSKSVVELAAAVNLIAELAPFKVVFVAFKTAVVERSTRPLPIVTDARAAPLPIFVIFAVEAPSNFNSPWPATAPLISVDSKFTPSFMLNEEPFAIVTVTILLLPALVLLFSFLNETEFMLDDIFILFYK